MVLRNVAKTFSLEEQRQEINLIAQDLHDLATNYVSVESDPIFTASVAASISSTDVTNWNTAYSWGDHAQAGYLTTASLSGNVANWDAAYGWGDHSQAGYLTSETDPIFAASDAAAVTAAKISNWDNAYSWGDHSLSGYATQTFVNTALTNLNNWDTAYGWGDHSAAGYITNISSFSIGDLSDVDVTTSTPQNQETLFWSGTNWVPGPIPQTGIQYTDLSVVVASTPFGNGNLTYNDSLGEFTFTPPVTFSGSYNDLSNTPNIPSQLNDLSDVIVAGTINNNDVISWDGAHWTPTPLSNLGGGIALTNLSVTVNSPGSANLSYNNTTGVFSYTPPDLSAYLTSIAINLSEISDVNISGTPANNAVLKYSTSTNQWELAVDNNDPGLALTDFSVSNNSASGGGSLAYNNNSGVFSFTPPVLPNQLNNFTDVNISGTPANGDILKFNASTSQWELGQESTPQNSAGEPVGTIAAWAGGVSSIPSGWLLCDGSLISRTTYADLFASIGTYHGGGDGSTSFTLPDLRNKFIVGAHSDQGTGQVFDVGSGSVTGHYAPGDTGGEVAHKLTIAEMPQHSHTEVGWSFQTTAASPGPGGAGTTSNNASGLAGDDNYHENRPPYFALCWIVKALPGAASSNSGGGGGSGGGGSIDLTAFSVNVATAGTANLSYNNLTGVFTYTPPDLSGYSTFSGSYNDLTDKPNIPQSLNDLLDVVISGTPADGAVIKYNSSNSRWELGSDTGGTGSSGGGSLPQGSIIMWSGDTSSIPTGWQLCDGTNGTPDLRNRFVIGAGDTYPVGNTGGNADSVVVEHSHTINDHNHTFSGSGSDNVDISVSGTTGNQSQSHNHNFTTNTTGEHRHDGTIPIPWYTGDTDRGTESSIFSADNSQTQVTTFAGDHNHSGTTGGQSDDHTHTFSGSGSDTVDISVSGTTGVQSDSGTSTAGSSGTGTNIPPYYALCFIYCVTPSGGTTTGATDLDDLTDVVITSPTAGQVLKYNGTNWVNDTDSTSSGCSAIYEQIGLESWTSVHNAPILFTQAENDPVGNYNQFTWLTAYHNEVTGIGANAAATLQTVATGEHNPFSKQTPDGVTIQNAIRAAVGGSNPSTAITAPTPFTIVPSDGETETIDGVSYPVMGRLYVPTSIGNSIDVIVAFHGTIEDDDSDPANQDGIAEAALTTLQQLTNQNTVNLRDKIIFSAAYPQDHASNVRQYNLSGVGREQADFLMGDNLPYARAAVKWVKNSLDTYIAAQGGSQTINDVYLFGHSQGGKLVTKINTLDTGIAGVVANAPGPIQFDQTCSSSPSEISCAKIAAIHGPACGSSNSGGSGIALTDLSVTTNSVGTAALSYNNTTGVFSYTPPDLSAYLTSVSINIGDINNVAATTPNDGDVLTWNASLSTWQPAAASGGASGSGTTHQWADGVEASGWSASDLSDYMFNGNLSLFAKAETSGTDYLGWDNSANGANLPVLNGPVEIFIRYADVGNYTYEVNGVTVTPDLTGVDTNGDWITLTSGTAGSFRVTAPSTSSNIQIAGVKSNGLLLTPTALYGGSSGGGSTFNLDANLNTSTASAGEILSWNGTDYEWVADQTGSGASTFTSLTDTPSTLTADKWIKVNSAGDGIEFVDAPSGGSGGGSGVIVPPGTVMSWAGDQNSIPSGYQLCDGSAVSRTVYSDLYLAIGDTHGAGDGSTTFNLPDLRNRFIVGEGSSYATAATGGSADATLVSHSHNINNHTHSFSGSGSDTVDISVSGTTGNQSSNHTHSFTTDTNGDHAHQWGTDDNLGAGGGTNNPDANGGQAWKDWTTTNGAHTHSGSTSGVSTNHNHTFSGSGSDNVSISISGTTGNPSDTGTDSQGSSATGANLPPYYALCYIIKMDAYAGGGGGGSSYTDSDVNAHLNTSSASSGQILSWDGSDFVWVDDQTGGSGSSGGGSGYGLLQSQNASGSEISFSGIPADAKEITIMFGKVGVTDTSQHLLVQLGTSTGWIASGYYASSEAENGTYDVSSSSGFPIHNRNSVTNNGNRFTGSMIINLMPTGSSNSYTQIGQFHRWSSNNDGTDVGSSCQSFGVVSGIDDSLTITRVRILANHAGGSQTFTTGIFGVSYKGSGSSGSGTGITDGDKGDITVSSSGSTWTIDDGVISTAKIATGAVNSGKLATNSVTTTAIEAGAVTIAKIGASGTPDATTFLRGDGNWVIPPSSGSGIALTDLSVTVNSPGTANFTYSNSTGVFTYTPPDLSAYSTFSGSYNDLTDKPTLFSGSYDDLTNKPVLFSGNYNDLTNKPTVPSGIDDLNDVTISAVSNGSPADGDVLTWSTSSGQWVNQQPSGGGGSSSSGGGIALLPAQTINSAVQATLVEFDNIPPDVLEITVMFEGVSLSGTDDFEIQLGTSSGYIVSNYESLSQNEGGADKRNSTSSFILRSDIASRVKTGSMLIKKASDTSYVQTGQFAISPSSSEGGNQTYGSLSSVSGTVNKLRIKSSGSNHFDAGSISVSYKTAGSASTTAPADDSPVGVIAMWSGSASNIPSGWQLCNGGSPNTTELQSVVGSTVPDLRDKFIVGAGNSYSVGSTGGSPNAVVVEHSHTGESHAHGINTSFNISASGTTSTDDVPHTHPIAGTVGTGSGLNAGADYTGNYSPRSTNAATDTNHSHTFSINTTASLSGSTENSGGGNTGVEGVNAEGKNLPPYYSLCYIIKNDASLYLKSPNGTSFRLSVDNSGNVSATSV